MLPISLARYQLTRRPQHLIVHVTNRCNLRCQHCFVDFSQACHLPANTIRRLARQAGRLLWLDIGGGEPFLRNDLAQILSPFKAEIIQIPTNGTLTRQCLEQVGSLQRRVRSKIIVSVSIDGSETTHDRLRGKAGVWRQAWQTFEALKKLENVQVKINSVLGTFNESEILELMRFVRAKGPDFHSIILVRGGANQIDPLLPPIHRLKELGPQILNIQQTYTYGQNPLAARMLINYHHYLWDLSLRALERKTQPIPCLGGRAHAVVWADGSVAPCELLPSVDNLAEKGFYQILKSPDWERQVASIRAKRCFCTHNCAMLDSVFFRPASIFPLLFQPAATPIDKGGL